MDLAEFRCAPYGKALKRFQTKEPKPAKEKAKNYANQNPGLYWLEKTETVVIYFTEKELDEND